MTEEKCTKQGCDREPLPRRYGGKLYCVEHYRERLLERLAAEYSKWEARENPPEKFTYLLGRVGDEMGWWGTEEESYLSAARVRDRGFGFEKTENGCRFKIVRHPEAFSGTGSFRRVTQTWEADLEAEILRMVEEREFREGDVD